MKNCSTSKNSITSIAIGGFDGMHLAHQELFKKLDNNGAILVIETGYANLTPNKYREKYTKYPLFYYLLEDIKHLSGEKFIKLLINEFPNLKSIIVGFDFRFGLKATCNIDNLNTLFHGNVIIIDEYCHNNIAVHSRTIRKYIENGELDIANKLLSRCYSIHGVQINGQGIGKKQFFPTINIICKDILLPQAGVYASYSIVNNIKYLSVTFLGHRISTDGQYAIETHIIDKNITIKDNNVTICFIKKIRNNKKFYILKELKEQIIYDVGYIKKKFKVINEKYSCC